MVEAFEDCLIKLGALFGSVVLKNKLQNQLLVLVMNKLLSEDFMCKPKIKAHAIKYIAGTFNNL